jgi:geranylgeranyl reductase
MESFDIVIVGAGPAGLKCAETLGNSRFSVLLLEKNPEIGPKVCAGGLTGKDLEYLDLPDELLDFKFNEIKLHVRNTAFNIKHTADYAFTVDRKNLGQWQLKKLEKFSNITVRTNSKVSKIKKDFLIVNDQKISYHYLVGADGSASKVKRFLGLKSRSVNIAIQYIIPTQKYSDFELFFDSKLFSAWYAWIFPHENYVSVGCVCNPKYLSANDLSRNFHHWLKKRKIDITDAKYEAFMLDYDYQGFRFDPVFLVGDAAGFVSGFTGEGIYQALISGEEVAKIILDNTYQPERMNELLTIKRKHNKVLDLLIEKGKYRQMLFFLGAILFKIPYFTRKAIRSLG